MSGYASHMEEYHANASMISEPAQDHTYDLANIVSATQSDEEFFITLMSTHGILMQQLITVDLKLNKVNAEVARSKSSGSDQSHTHVPATLNPTGYCWQYGYKV